MNEIVKKISNYGLVPAVVIDDIKHAVPVAKALAAGGIPVAEITFRTACAAEAIAKIAKEVPEVIVGAGTVLTLDQAKEAVACGSKFIVAPGFNPTVVQYCLDNNVPVIPGCSCPADIEQALAMGLDTVKFFPAEQSGGIAALKALAGPYFMMKFLPTGGISDKNIVSYLSLPNVIACGGSYVIDKKALAEENYDKITELTKAAVKTINGFEIAHVGMHADGEDDQNNVLNFLSMAFDMPISKVFAGTAFEVLSKPYLGKNGHIAIFTNSCERAVQFMTDKGIKFNPDGMKYNDKGKLNAAYLEGEYAGFALHLLQRKF